MRRKLFFSFKSKVDEVNNPDSTDQKVFNFRQSIKNVFNENYEKSLMEIGSLLTKVGFIETYNSNNNLIRKVTFKQNKVDSLVLVKL